MSIQYIGEHLVPGQVGHALIWIAFISGIIAAVLFFLRTRNRESCRKVLRTGSRLFYIIQVLLPSWASGSSSIISSSSIILNMPMCGSILRLSLPLKYIISCFWAGQEGSFLIWAMLQAVIGLVLMWRSKGWEPWVMVVFTLSQVFLVSMSLGIHLGGVQIGSTAL